jgi:hypothetical protein
MANPCSVLNPSVIKSSTNTVSFIPRFSSYQKGVSGRLCR